MKFFTYTQSNSGGDFLLDDDVSHHVIIEAESADDANKKAEDIGLYFYGIESGLDCPCCGDRWYPVDDLDGTTVPEIYGNPADEHHNLWLTPNDIFAYVYYADGTKVGLSEKPIVFHK